MSYRALDLANLSRSLNEALILAVLARGRAHGYQLVHKVAEATGGDICFKHGTLYPILHRLEKAGLVAGAWSDSGPRGRRRAYRLTDGGRRHLEELRQEWHRLATLLAHHLEEAP